MDEQKAELAKHVILQVMSIFPDAEVSIKRLYKLDGSPGWSISVRLQRNEFSMEYMFYDSMCDDIDRQSAKVIGDIVSSLHSGLMEGYWKQPVDEKTGKRRCWQENTLPRFLGECSGVMDGKSLDKGCKYCVNLSHLL